MEESPRGMGGLLNRLHGPYFDFLVLDEYGITKWEEEGVPWDVIPTYYHHPDALRVPDSVVGLGMFYFLQANSSFYYWGISVYGGEDLDKLLMWLRLFVDGIRVCREPREFKPHLTGLFEAYFTEVNGAWQNYWPRVRDEVADCFEEIILLVREAQERKQVLLVLGV